MKTNKGCIGDNNVGYNTKMEGYTTSMSDMNELYEICQPIVTLTFADDKIFNITVDMAISEIKGDVYVYLVDKKSFNIPFSGIMTITKQVTSNKLIVKFKNIPKGVYGIRCYQDLNGNMKLDKGLFGPKEPRAMSWSKGRVFPPRFVAISFLLEKNISLKLELKKKEVYHEFNTRVYN